MQKELVLSAGSGSNSAAVTDSQGRPISHSVANALRTAESRIRPAVVAARVWERLFTEDDRQRLGGDLERCWPRLGTVRMWRQARGGSLEQAVIEVAYGTSFLDEQTANWLRCELNISDRSSAAPDDRPTWDAERGQLRFGNDLIRRVRVLRNPSNIQRVLDAFEAAGWPRRIDNPLTRGQEQLHQTLRSLNRGLRMIRFHGQKGAKAITWDPL